MSRTPLLNSVRQFMSEIRAERGLGSSVGAENQGGMNRRDFVLGAAAIAAASLMPKAAWAGSTVPSIVIIGAGIAGLNCALTLADRHERATIYEASHRVGGRMFSNRDTWDDGQVSEWCGELIDTGHKTVRSLAKRFDLPLDDLLAAQPQASEDTNYFAGHYYSQSQARADFFALADVVDADLTAAGYPTRFDAYTDAGYMLDHMSVYDWIESRIPGGHHSQLGKLLDVAYNVEYGAETTEQSALNLLYLLGFQSNPKSFGVFGESDERFHIRGGNDRLTSAIAAHLGQDRFRFGHKLTRISQNGKGGYHLVFNTQSGIQNVSCDILVLAVPFSVLRDIDYTDAGFDARKHMAIQQLGRGRNGKLQFQFKQRVWNQTGAWPGKSNGSSYSDTGYQASWDVTRAQEGVSGILVLYSGGKTTEAMLTQRPFSTASHAPAVQDALQGLQQAEVVFPGLTQAWNGKITQSLPHLNPFMKASYAYYGVGQYTAFGGYEGANQGRAFFCGDHTSQDYQGYMEGGALEGERAGRDVYRIVHKIS